MPNDGSALQRADPGEELQSAAPLAAVANATGRGIPSQSVHSSEWQLIAEKLGLSNRQLQIVKCIFDGLDEASIGKRLRVSSHTIHSHLNRLYRKLNVRSRCELIVCAFLVLKS